MTLQYVSQITLGANASTITLSNIPQTATDLVIYASLRNSNTSELCLFNPNASTSSLSHVGLVNAATSNSTTQAWIRGVAKSNAGSSTGQSSHIITVANYANNQQKIAYVEGGYADSNYTYHQAYFASLLWASTAAITSIRFTAIENFVAGSTVTLYTRTRA